MLISAIPASVRTHCPHSPTRCTSETHIIRREVLVDNFIRQFIDIFIFMILKLLNFFQSCIWGAGREMAS